MRKLALVITALVIGTSSVSAEDIDVIIQKRILDATVKILVVDLKDANKTLSGGSGTIIFNGDHTGELGVVRRIVIASAAHVAKPQVKGFLSDDGRIETEEVSSLRLMSYIRDNTGQIRGSQSFDLANNFEVIKSEVKLIPSVDAAFIIIDLKPTSRWLVDVQAVEMAGTVLSSRLKIGSDILIAGCPIVMDPVIFRNRLIQRNVHNLGFRREDYLGHLVSRVLTGGNSGGGVYNAQGQFIGIVTLRIGTDFGAFTGIEHILPLVISDRDIMLLLNP